MSTSSSEASDFDMFLDKASNRWISEHYRCSNERGVGDTMLIGHGRGPWSVLRVKIVNVVELGGNRIRVEAVEV